MPGCKFISFVSWRHGDGDDVASPGRPVIDGGSRGAVGVATQVAGECGQSNTSGV